MLQIILCSIATIIGLVGMQLAVMQNGLAGSIKLAATLLFFGIFVYTTAISFSIGTFILSVGMLFALLGDYFLSYRGGDADFLFGAASFLIGYLLFAVSGLFKIENFNLFTLIPITLVIAFSIFQFTFLKAGDKTIPIAIYLVIQMFLLSVSIATLNPILIMGAALLYFSDSVIAHQMFNTGWPFKQYFQYIIMPTYYLGLSFFVRGFLPI